MKPTTNKDKSKVFTYAWELVNKLGYTIKTALLKAWRLFKQSNKLSIDTIKATLKEFKGKLIGRALIVNNIEYRTLKAFGNAILKLSNFDFINCLTWSEGNGTMCINALHSLRYSLQNDRFDKVIITANTWATPLATSTDYSRVNWSKFGTTV